MVFVSDIGAFRRGRCAPWWDFGRNRGRSLRNGPKSRWFLQYLFVRHGIRRIRFIVFVSIHVDRVDNSRGHDAETLRLSCFPYGGAEKVSRRRGCRAGRFYVSTREM